MRVPNRKHTPACDKRANTSRSFTTHHPSLYLHPPLYLAGLQQPVLVVEIDPVPAPFAVDHHITRFCTTKVNQLVCKETRVYIIMANNSI